MNTIRVKDFGNVYLEKTAEATITPGMLIESTSTDTVQAHSTEGGNAFPMFALEDELQGNGITDDYSADDQVSIMVAQRGDEVYAILATNQTISIGDVLESAGDGTLQKHVPKDISDAYQLSDDNVYVNAIVGVATEAVTTTSAVGRIIVRVL